VSEQAVWTVLELVRWTQKHFETLGIGTSRLDAECLLAFALGVSRLQLYLEFDKPVLPLERDRFRALVRRRGKERVPVAYLTGTKEFWSLPLHVTPDVLIPRPDTEILVAAALEYLPDAETAASVLDVGTGSGAIALALAKERPKLRVTATDLSRAALDIARRNAQDLALSAQICFLEGDLFEPVSGQRFDLIAANLPYVAERDRDTLAPELAYEPHEALFAGVEGLAALERFARTLPAVLNEGGVVIMEIAPEQAAQVMAWLRQASLIEVKTHEDLMGQVRAVSARAACAETN